MTNSSLYGKDFSTWLEQQIVALQSRDECNLDWEHLAEELVLMGISERNQLKSRLAVLLAHLLKWHYHPNKRSISWFTTIANQRDDIEDLLKDNPGLKQYIPGLLGKAYRNARRDAAAETGLALKTFPDGCPYSLVQVLDPGFLCDTTDDFTNAMGNY
ncbi:DUF29 domain-containing protein [Synechocystis sp. LEGE 06083]|uniref:DUF29 domain-containing protein n=1 Tax=Synechocystis sp. LEGE 06083 TaxID=915336 RepID=UPI0018801A08|nr:DUF29 domain-containing protein [Synechocystis sp. LEGE 06083]MBE9194453.1 DUF29 domain-containing protein [Synechocystis sp. LEGE 06083]